MEHWHAVLPGKILHVQHEDVLDDLDGSGPPYAGLSGTAV